MSYIRTKEFAGIWGQGVLPKIKVSEKGGRSFILPSRPDYYSNFYGRPYIGQKPPPPLFSRTRDGESSESIFKSFLFF